MVFFIHIEAYDTKIMAMIWVLFTAVEFHTLQSDKLPEIGYLVTADQFFLVTYTALCLVLVHILVLDRLHRDKRYDAVKRLNRIAYFLYPVFFFGPIGLLIWSSLR